MSKYDTVGGVCLTNRTEVEHKNATAMNCVQLNSSRLQVSSVSQQ